MSCMANCSLAAILRVPTSNGRPVRWIFSTSSTIAAHLVRSVRKNRSGKSRRMHGRFVGMRTTGKPYVCHNSADASDAVPVMPDRRWKQRKKF